MKRRDFLQFMSVSSASIAASTALAKIPEANKKIILLDTPKEIVIAKAIPEVDFVVTNLVSINYINKESVQVFESLSTPQIQHPSVGMQQINIQCEFEFFEKEINLFKRLVDPRTFTFNLDMRGSSFVHLMELNGRKFILAKYNIELNHDHILRYSLNGIELVN